MLVEKLRNRTISSDEINELAESFFELARNMSAAIGGKNDEYLSVAKYAIAFALSRAAEKLEDDNLQNWLKVCVYRFLKKFKIEDHIIRIPYRTMKRNNLEKFKRRELNENISSYDKESPIIDFFETRSDKIDQDIIRLRVEGYTDDEIGDKLSKSRSYIQNRRRMMKKDFNNYMTKIAS